MYRTLQFRLCPNKEQIVQIENTLYSVRFVKKLCLEKNDSEECHRYAKGVLDRYLEEYPILKQIDYSAMFNALLQLSKKKDPAASSTRNSYTSTYNVFMRKYYPIENGRVWLSRIGWVRYIQTRELPEQNRIIRFCIKKDKEGHYDLLILYNKQIHGERKGENGCSVIGFDYSSKHFIVDSEGNYHDIPHFYREELKTIRTKEKKLNKKVKGSKRYIVEMNSINKLNHKVKRRRKDYLHKLSTEFADKYDCIAVETLDLKGISKSKRLAKATRDNAYWTFLHYLEYKMEDRGKKLIRISQWYPSSKICSNCGYALDYISLKTKIWQCPNCLQWQDRDINAAKNIRNEGYRILQSSAGRAEH